DCLEREPLGLVEAPSLLEQRDREVVAHVRVFGQTRKRAPVAALGLRPPRTMGRDVAEIHTRAREVRIDPQRLLVLPRGEVVLTLSLVCDSEIVVLGGGERI